MVHLKFSLDGSDFEYVFTVKHHCMRLPCVGSTTLEDNEMNAKNGYTASMYVFMWCMCMYMYVYVYVYVYVLCVVFVFYVLCLCIWVSIFVFVFVCVCVCMLYAYAYSTLCVCCFLNAIERPRGAVCLCHQRLRPGMLRIVFRSP